MTPLMGRTALVTGASRGIGRRLAADGALVAVHYGSDEAAARESIRPIEKDGAFAVRAELGVTGDVDTLLAGMKAQTGQVRLDILVDNAAITADSIETITPEAFDRLIAVNVKEPLFTIQRGPAAAERRATPSPGPAAPPTSPTWWPSWPPRRAAG